MRRPRGHPRVRVIAVGRHFAGDQEYADIRNVSEEAMHKPRRGGSREPIVEAAHLAARGAQGSVQRYARVLVVVDDADDAGAAVVSCSMSPPRIPLGPRV